MAEGNSKKGGKPNAQSPFSISDAQASLEVQPEKHNLKAGSALGGSVSILTWSEWDEGGGVVLCQQDTDLHSGIRTVTRHGERHSERVTYYLDGRLPTVDRW